MAKRKKKKMKNQIMGRSGIPQQKVEQARIQSDTVYKTEIVELFVGDIEAYIDVTMPTNITDSVEILKQSMWMFSECPESDVKYFKLTTDKNEVVYMSMAHVVTGSIMFLLNIYNGRTLHLCECSIRDDGTVLNTFIEEPVITKHSISYKTRSSKAIPYVAALLREYDNHRHDEVPSVDEFMNKDIHQLMCHYLSKDRIDPYVVYSAERRTTSFYNTGIPTNRKLDGAGLRDAMSVKVIPELQLTAREWQKVENTIYPTNDVNSVLTDLNLVDLCNCRFGNVIHVKGFNSIPDFTFYSNQPENDDDNTSQIVVLIESEPGIKLLVGYTFDNCRCCTVSEDLIGCTIHLLVDPGSMIKVDADYKIINHIPDIMKDQIDDVDTLLHYVIMFLIFADQCKSELMQVDESKSSVKKSTYSGRKKTTSKTSRPNGVVVKKMIKTKYQAKKMMKESSERGETIYTIDSWWRAAHQRRLKNGTVLNVEETQCFRNEKYEIQDPEKIILKL